MFLLCFGGLQTGRCFYEQRLYAVMGWPRALSQFDPVQVNLPVRKSLCQASNLRINSALPAQLTCTADGSFIRFQRLECFVLKNLSWPQLSFSAALFRFCVFVAGGICGRNNAVARCWQAFPAQCENKLPVDC